MQVGDYVRTKYGISKIENISPNDYDKEHDYVELDKSVFDGLDIQIFFTTDEIIKTSPNIIDLIQVGDYVNGRKVEWVGDDFVAFGKLDYAYKKDIKSIVTREQFLQMEYKIESEVN